jgi:hypothetical protein
MALMSLASTAVLAWFVIGRRRRTSDPEPVLATAVASLPPGAPSGTPSPTVSPADLPTSAAAATATAAKASKASPVPRAPKPRKAPKARAPIVAEPGGAIASGNALAGTSDQTSSLPGFDPSAAFVVLGAGAAVLEVPFEEAHIPRWRRPSLKAARQMSERYPSTERAPMRFRTPTADGIDRRQVVYRLVRVGSEPDELAGEELGRVDRGDEVEVIDRKGAYCFIQAPDGVAGWVHRTTLGVLEDAPEALPEGGPDQAH